ncbi:MAG: hypothetical protein MR051_05140 [Lentisphaeria bacterium]|nr:hypothetical protein [Lentisphaeria bacterium]
MNKHHKALCAVATFYLILMNQQYVLAEGDQVSNVKVVAMCIAPVFGFFFVPYFSKAVGWGIVYLIWLFMSMYLRFDTPRLETLGYNAMFIGVFMVFYNMVQAGAFTKEFFQKLMRYFLWAYIICLIVQQIVSISLRTEMPWINLYYLPGENITKVPSLSLEPSHSARIMAAIFYGFLKTSELIKGEPVTLKDLFGEYRKLAVAFLYVMISMYSGTAIFMLVLLSFYFFQRRQLFYVIPLFITAFLFLPDVDYDPVQRAVVTSEATLTGDSEEVISADGSAAARVAPVLNAFKMDFSDIKTWLGHGTDAARNAGHLTQENTIWTDRGIICYLIGLLLVFSCAIKPFLSLATLIFVCGLGGSLINVYYVWGMLMTFTCITYFVQSSEQETL